MNTIDKVFVLKELICNHQVIDDGSTPKYPVVELLEIIKDFLLEEGSKGDGKMDQIRAAIYDIDIALKKAEKIPDNATRQERDLIISEIRNCAESSYNHLKVSDKNAPL